MYTIRTLYEIEIALAKSKYFNYVNNIVAFNVHGISSELPLFHECDMLVLSKSGYLSEIEIKRSWNDFLSDFKKKHNHPGNGLVKFFYYCIPKALIQRAYEKLEQENTIYSGIITYSEDLKIQTHGYRYLDHAGKQTYIFRKMCPHKKLSLEQQFQIARFGAMRAIMLKEKLINKINPVILPKSL